MNARFHYNTIQGNTVTGPGHGILVDPLGHRNLIFGNRVTVSGKGYIIPTGNSFGPIVDVTRAGDISGTPGAEHALANFEY